MKSMVFASVALAMPFGLAMGQAAPLSLITIKPSEISAIDGDTIRWNGERVRLLGYDTPEVFSPRCHAEKRNGEAAKAALSGLVQSALSAELLMSLRRDRHGRILAALRLDGQDVAEWMIGAGLAVRYDGGRRRDWCGH